MSAAGTLTLTDFLLARIAEDAAMVTESTRRLAPRGHKLLEQFGDFGDDERFMIEIPAGRVLAECEAKLRIVELHRPVGEDWGGGPYYYGADIDTPHGTPACASCGTADEYAVRFPCGTLRALAAVYSGHPDCREEWKL